MHLAEAAVKPNRLNLSTSSPEQLPTPTTRPRHAVGVSLWQALWLETSSRLAARRLATSRVLLYWEGYPQP
jgi:hypothetical protein